MGNILYDPMTVLQCTYIAFLPLPGYGDLGACFILQSMFCFTLPTNHKLEQRSRGLNFGPGEKYKQLNNLISYNHAINKKRMLY